MQAAPISPRNAHTWPSVAPAVERKRYAWEIAIVLGLTVGQSAVYSLLSLLRSWLRSVEQKQSIAQQHTQLNSTQDSAAFWDVLSQLLGIFFSLFAVALVIYLLWRPGGNPFRRIGLTFQQPGRDVLRALTLAAIIGIPGLLLYITGRLLGLSVQVQAAPLDGAWYTIPILFIAAVRAGVLEETIFNGYLFDRLRRCGWNWWAVIIGAAVVRGLYHSYQGIPAILGNFVMGVIFGWCYRRWGRVMPLVIAHTLIDTVAFIGYPFAVSTWPNIF